ncbi:unnamed protein product [Ectocarpus sp. 4 AP-2014]
MEEVDAVSRNEGMTALHRAAAGGHTNAARVLMLAGASVGLVDSKGFTALHYAIEGGHLPLAEDLVIAGADLEAKDGDSNTPLHLAAAHNDDNFIRTLIRRGVRVSVLSKAGQQPLHIAVKREHVAVANALWKAGADPDVRFGDLERCSPLQLARSDAEMTKILLGSGADVKSVDTLGYTALHWAAFDGIPEVVHAIVEVGADVEARRLAQLLSEQRHSLQGLTPLHVAAYWDTLDTMIALIQKGANGNARDDDGHGSLHLVCKYPNPSSVAVADLLLRWGADETATDNDGNTPADYIQSSDESDGRLERLLVNAPADRACRRRGTLAMVRTQDEDAANVTTTDSVLPRLVSLEDEALFQEILRFS